MTAKLVSPSDLNPKDTETGDADLNKNLFQLMNGSRENEVEELDDINNQSPAKNKPRKSGSAATKSDTLVKHKVKSALKTGFLDNHVHNAPRVLASIYATEG